MILKKLSLITLAFAVCSVLAQNEHCTTPNDVELDLNAVGKCAIENFKNSNTQEFVKVSTRNRYVRRKTNTYLTKLRSNLNTKSVSGVASVLSINSVDQLPLFNSCLTSNKSDQFDCFEQTVRNHVAANLTYPADALRRGIEDEVLATFTVNSNGFVKDVKAKGTKGVVSLESEAKRIISNLPQLIPAKHQGKTAEVRYNFYISFELDESQKVTAQPAMAVAASNGSSEANSYIKNFIRFDLVSQKPIFINCSDNELAEQQECIRETIANNIVDNLIYPFDAASEGIQGTVWVRFIIDEDGYVTDITASGPSNGKLLEEEAERLVKLLPKFVPGKHNNQYVNVEYFIPIDFQLNE